MNGLACIVLVHVMSTFNDGNYQLHHFHIFLVVAIITALGECLINYRITLHGLFGNYFNLMIWQISENC